MNDPILAFDTVKRENILKVLEDLEMMKDLINIINDIDKVRAKIGVFIENINKTRGNDKRIRKFRQKIEKFGTSSIK